MRSTTRVPLRLATRTNYINVNRDNEFENLSWKAMSDQAISYAFLTEICRGNYKYLFIINVNILQTKIQLPKKFNLYNLKKRSKY